METSIDKSKKENLELVSSIKIKLEAISSLKSIFKVPTKLRTHETTYTPNEVSIGPFHRGKDNLSSMEKHKWHYLHTLLSRKPNPETTLYECVKALRDTEQTARNCYAEEVLLTHNDFVEMLLLDGCFIIELFFKYAFKGLRRGGDPIFSKPKMLYTVRCNLILLENQIPLFILQTLFEIVPTPLQCTQTLSELAFRFFKKMLPGEREFLSWKFSQEGNHLLDLIRQCYLPSYLSVQSNEATLAKDFECATKLGKHGIKFIRYKAKSLLDISFSNGAFEIPPLVTHQFTEVLFANLIALEQHESDDHVQHFTSYALLMKAFVHCEKDVKLFRHLRILVSEDEKKEEKEEKGQKETECCELFKRLCNEVDVKGFYYAGVVEQAIKYKGTRGKWRQALPCRCLN